MEGSRNKMKEMIAFTDGKYSFSKKICSYGCTAADKSEIEKNEKKRLMICRKTFEDGYAMKEYTGQMKAILTAISFAVRQHYDGVIVYTPCSSFEHWYNGDWAAETRFAQEYLNRLYEMRKQIRLQVRSKVPSSYCVYMERTEKMAKEILN